MLKYFPYFTTKYSNKISLSAIGAIFGVCTLLLNTLAHQHRAFVEQWYSRGLFQIIRSSIDWTIGRLPFPTFYLFWAGVVAFWVLLYRRRLPLPFFCQKLGYWLARLAGFAGLLVGLFFWLWGFNYARIPLEKQIGLDKQPLDTTAMWQDLRSETQAVDSLRKMLVGSDTSAINDQRFWPIYAEDTVRAAVTKWLASEGFPVGGHVRGRFIYPEGTLSKFGAGGIYWPFVGEGNVEAGLHNLRKLPAMAHEMSHGYGFSDEGVCNFIAYAAFVEQPNTYLAYCARLDYWSSLAHACWLSDPQRYDREYRPGIPAGIAADQLAIELQNDKFRELAPAIRYQVYDSYLKAQGIASGMLNYEEVLMLVHAWRKKQRVQ